MITLRLILEAVAEHSGLSEVEIVSDRRTPRTSLARQTIYALARRLTTMSMPVIGRLMGRDHTTVLYGARRIEDRAAIDPVFAEELMALEAAIRAADTVISRAGVSAELADIDAEAVALQVLASRRALTTISNIDLRALARAAIAASVMSETAGAASGLVEASRAVIAARRKLRQARHSPGERHALGSFEAALDTLHTTLTEFEEMTDG